MNMQEFLQATARAETYFDKQYSNEQSKIMYDTFKEWTLHDYAKALTYCIENKKFLPKIADIKEFKTEYRPDYTTKEEQKYKSCSKCKEGFVFFKKKFENYMYEFVALCTCENGQQRFKQGYQYKYITEVR